MLVPQSGSMIFFFFLYPARMYGSDRIRIRNHSVEPLLDKKKSDNVEKIIVYSAKLALRERDKIYIWLQIFSINYSNVFFTKK